MHMDMTMIKRIIIAVILVLLIPVMVIAEQSAIQSDVADPQAIIDVLSNG